MSQTTTKGRKMNTIKTEPQVIEVEAGRDIVITVEGVPVVYLRSEGVMKQSTYDGDEYDSHKYVGSGIYERRGDYLTKFLGSCSNTGGLYVPEATVEATVETIKARA